MPDLRSRKRGTQTVFGEGARHAEVLFGPSAILRTPDDETRRREKRHFIDDLKQVGRVLSKS